MFRLSEEQMDMFRHDYIAGDDEAISLANLFKDLEEDVTTMNKPEKRSAVMAATGDEMEFSVAVDSLESFGHGGRLYNPTHIKRTHGLLDQRRVSQSHGAPNTACAQ